MKTNKQLIEKIDILINDLIEAHKNQWELEANYYYKIGNKTRICGQGENPRTYTSDGALKTIYIAGASEHLVLPFPCMSMSTDAIRKKPATQVCYLSFSLT